MNYDLRGYPFRIKTCNIGKEQETMNLECQPRDPAQDYLQKIAQPLDALFSPQNAALIGAKDDKGSVARTILKNLLQGDLTVYPVNPKRKEVLGIKAYPTVKDIPAPIDLAVIATPAKTVPGIIAECIESSVKSAIVISAGFKELGESGEKLEQEILRHLKNAAMPIVGPNCLGVMNPFSGLNATFSKQMAKKGNVAFLSQSGALCTAVLDWSFEVNLGFSAFVSVGSMIDVDWGDLIAYFGDDPNTHSILLYMETVGDPRSFLSASREVALQKPIVVIKPGRTTAAAKAAASHTGSLVGNDAVFEAALERAGVIRVENISELFEFAEVLAKQPLPKGPRLGIITNAGGPAVLATDAAIQNGAQVPPLSAETKTKLDTFLPEAWSHNNPVDILGDASAKTYDQTIKAMIESAEFDGILTILTPQDMTEPLESAKSLAKHSSDKPLLASWMGAEAVAKSRKILSGKGICSFEFPDEAAAAFAKMWRRHQNLLALYQFPSQRETIDSGSYDKQQNRIAKAGKFLSEERKILTEEESKSLLAIYDIPIVETHQAKRVEEAVKKAKQIGFPVVLKLLSSTITHKSDVGGVRLNLNSEQEVKKAFALIRENVERKDFDGVTIQKMIDFEGYELILGSSQDPQFGPVILFGAGGEMVEIYQDTALALPPLEPVNALRLMEKTKIFKAFKGYRGRKAIDQNKLIAIIVNFSKMISDNPWIVECDINPLLAGFEGIVSLDARIVADKKKTVRTALRAYPYEYCSETLLKNGKPVIIRPITGDDNKLLKAFHKELSEHTVHQRYLKFLALSERVAEERLIRICLNDYTHEYVLVAELSNEEKIIGVTRLSRIPSTSNAKLFMVISDACQKQGLGTAFMNQIIPIAKKEGVKKIIAEILFKNSGMIKLCKKYGFSITEENILVIMEKLL